MNRLITVKGTGDLSLKPDLIVITMDLESKNWNYDKTMQLATESIENLQNAIEIAGFEKKDLKTTRFSVNTNYESYKDKDGNYKSKFVGYNCKQGLKIEFDYDTRVMSDLLNAISKSPTKPEFRISFSIKDGNAVSEQLLVNATENARQKAEILAKASGVSLGNLVNIDYNWQELHLYSQLNYSVSYKEALSRDFSPDIEPEDIDVSDTVSFVWEIH